jgi:hypothetical protein
MIHKGHWVLLSARLVLDEKNLQLSPIGVVPQRDRRPRTICDYSFFFVNLNTIPLAPTEPMQFGRVMWRIMQQASDANPRLGPVHLSKIDIADGFYHIWIKAEDVPKIGVLFPSRAGKAPMIGFPLVLPMGWMQSPPLFTAATETVANLANSDLTNNVPNTPHRLDSVSKSQPQADAVPKNRVSGPASQPIPPPDRRAGRPHQAIKSWDVYVDDFIGMVQGSRRHWRHVKLILLHSLEQVFRKLKDTDDPHRQEPASVKKMRKGNAT